MFFAARRQAACLRVESHFDLVDSGFIRAEPPIIQDGRPFIGTPPALVRGAVKPKRPRQKNFDDALVGLVELFTKNNWALVNLEQLAKDAQEQRAQRTKHDTLQSQYLSEHESFGVAQDQRYQRFAAALNAARGAYRNDKAAIAALAPFKRAMKRKSASEQPQ